MFDIVMIVLVILSLGFPVAPWICGARRGLRRVWFSTALALVSLLGCFPILFYVACGACGQGAIAIFLLGPIWLVSAVLTVASAALAHFRFAR